MSAKCASEKKCENRLILGEGMNKGKVARFFAHPVNA